MSAEPEMPIMTQSSQKARRLAERGQELRQEFDYVLFRNTPDGNRRRENDRRNGADRRNGDRQGDAGRRNGTDRREPYVLSLFEFNTGINFPNILKPKVKPSENSRQSDLLPVTRCCVQVLQPIFLIEI